MVLNAEEPKYKTEAQSLTTDTVIPMSNLGTKHFLAFLWTL